MWEKPQTERLEGSKTAVTVSVRLTSVLGEQHILGLEICMNHLVAVQEDQATDDVQGHQMTLTASTQHTLHQRKGSSKGARGAGRTRGAGRGELVEAETCQQS